MKRMLYVVLLCVIAQAAGAQLVSRQYRDKPMSKVLVDLRRATSRYKISFIHNELEDYTVTKQFSQLTVPDAIRECIGFYPIQMKLVGDSLIFVEAMHKQGDKLIGRVVDERRRPVSYANIQLLAPGDTTLVASGVSNENGDFVIPTTERRLTARISCVGYETQVLHCEVGNIGTITLRETTEHISEVVVEGSLHRASQDRDVYLPNQRQRNASHSGLSLLENLMIPQLSVNRMTGEVKSLTNRDITFCIDGRIVEQKDLEDIRPKDVLRVEYIDMPSGQFADKDLVINFILRHYEYGGYVSAKNHTRFLHSLGESSVRARLDHKRLSYIVAVGSSYDNDRGIRNETEEDLIIDQTFHKSAVTRYDHYKQWENYAALGTRYQSDRLRLAGTMGIRQERTPDTDYREDLTYSGDVSDQTTAQSTMGTKNTTAYASVNADWTLTDRQRLTGNIRVSFGRNHYDNTYLEADGYGVEAHTRERTYAVRGDVMYSNMLSQRSSVSLRVIEMFTHYSDEYRGTLKADQDASQSETIVWPVYVYRPNSRWMFNFRPLGFSVAHWKTLTNSQTYLSSRGSVSVKHQLNPKSSLQYAVYLGNSTPYAPARSEVEQIVNRYEVIRGNPDLEKMIFATNSLNYSLMLSNWQLTAYAEYEQQSNMAVSTYEPENGRLVHSYGNSGSLHNLTLDVEQTLFLLNRNLQLKGGVKLVRNILTGSAGGTQNHADLNLKALYHMGDFSLSAYYESPERGLYNIYYRTAADYGVSATYGKKGFYAEIGARRMFLSNVSQRTYFTYAHYAFDSRAFRDRDNPWLYFRLAYTLDFGRKSDRQGADESIGAGSSGSSAILHK